ncbi:hypothetical protein Tco_0777737 [Tanacetum coccineum]
MASLVNRDAVSTVCENEIFVFDEKFPALDSITRLKVTRPYVTSPSSSIPVRSPSTTCDNLGSRIELISSTIMKSMDRVKFFSHDPVVHHSGHDVKRRVEVNLIWPKGAWKALQGPWPATSGVLIPFPLPMGEGNGVTRLKKYSELSATEAIQADCDVKATNIILQGLPPEERECKLYDEFDKFAYKKGETLLNTKFLNTLPPEWSKFMKDVKLVRDLHTTNIDQLHAYLGQHEFHANEVRLMHERNSDPLALVATHQMT